MSKLKFYFLSFTWGLPMTLIGCITATILMAAGYKPQRWGYCWYFQVGRGWGGVELGAVFITSKTAPHSTKNHEHGHAIQNCYFGVLMPFVVCIPSAIRYWARRFSKKSLPPYDSIWFEGQATRLGNQFMENL